jgi:hypothetical protein
MEHLDKITIPEIFEIINIAKKINEREQQLIKKGK